MAIKHFPRPIANRAMHGFFEVRVEGRILISRVCGPWNLEAVEAYRDEVNRHIKSLIGQPWGVLAIVGGEPIHTPESMQGVTDVIRLHRSLGRCATALVFADVEAVSLMKMMLAPMYIQSQEPYYFGLC
jgi:hypothetical protein